MIGFGLLLTGVLYVYTMLHTAPFRSLTAALAREYPGSAPRVEGGKPRLDEPGDRTLRITLRSPFDPADESRANSFAYEIATFASRHHDLNRYEIVEIHLYRERTGVREQPVAPRSAERNLSQRSLRLKVTDLEHPGTTRRSTTVNRTDNSP